MNQLTLPRSSAAVLPALIAAAGDQAARRFLEFFAAATRGRVGPTAAPAGNSSPGEASEVRMLGRLKKTGRQTSMRRFLPLVAFVATWISFTPAALAAPDDVPKKPVERLSYYVGLVVFFSEANERVLEVCDEKLPDERYKAAIRELRRANSPIVGMAKLKGLSAAEQAEGSDGRERFKSFLEQVRMKHVPELLRNKFPNLGAARDYCNNILRDVSAHFVVNRHPEAFSFILGYDVGYMRRFQGCEFATFFPIAPEVENTTSSGKPGVRMITPEFEDAPTITASCTIFKSGISDDILKKLLNDASNFFRKSGFSNISSTDSIKDGARVVTIIGRGQRSGFELTMSYEWYIGSNSLLEVTIGEQTDLYPSIITQQFFDTIRRQ